MEDKQVLSKQDLLQGEQFTALAKLMGDAMSRRTSDGRRTLEFSVMRLEASLEGLRRDVQKDLQGFDYRLEKGVVERLSIGLEAIEKRLNVLEYTIFPAKDLTGNPSVVTMVTSLRQGVASSARQISELNEDIGKLADLTRSRQDAFAKELEVVQDALVELKEAKAEDHELRLRRVDFFYSTGGKIVIAIAAVVLGLVVVQLAPELIDLLKLVFA
ncbi:MAG: hypothetical protein WBA99_03860 [Nodosilinea sp.]